MTIDRAIEILNPEHREHYNGMDEVNEACRMGMEALIFAATASRRRGNEWKLLLKVLECSL